MGIEFPMSKSAANQRREPRVPTANSALVIGATEIPLRNWSYSGFFAGPYDGKIAVGEEFALALRLRSDLGQAEIKGRGKLVRNDTVGIAGTWTLDKPTPQAELLLRYFLAYPDPLALEE